MKTVSRLCDSGNRSETTKLLETLRKFKESKKSLVSNLFQSMSSAQLNTFLSSAGIWETSKPKIMSSGFPVKKKAVKSNVKTKAVHSRSKSIDCLNKNGVSKSNKPNKTVELLKK